MTLRAGGEYLGRMRQAVDFLKGEAGEAPPVAFVLGSGWSGLLGQATADYVVPYSTIPNFPAISVSGHAGTLSLGQLGASKYCILDGRVHLYEGFEAHDVVFAVRVLGLWGVRVFVLTNAAGALNAAYSPGDLMVIRDHLNLLGANPLTGVNLGILGERFPDMTRVYSPRLIHECREVARQLGLRLREGIYAAVTGPSYETPAEVRMLVTLGADAVGMSTVPEAIALNHMGKEVLALSCITNPAAGRQSVPLRHVEVLAIAEQARCKNEELMRGLLLRIRSVT